MEAEVDTLHLLTQPKEGQQQFKNKKQPELTENRTSWKLDKQGDKEETFIQTSSRGGDGQPGQRGLVAGQRLVDPVRWQIVELKQLVDPAAPHSCIDKLEGMVGERNRLRNPGLQLREIKPQNSD